MNNEYNRKESICPVCSSKDIIVFIEISQVPIYCNVLWPTRNEALNAPKGEITLGYCKGCGHIFNLTFDPALINYAQNYENSLYYSPSFQLYARLLAKQLIDRYGLHNKDIIEIGCGNGDFLMLLCELGGNRGIGFDQSYLPGQGEDTAKGQVTFIQDFYSKRYSHYKADFICCRHVLEHIHCPKDFLIKLHNTIGRQDKIVVFFEVPNVIFTLRDLSIWDIIYEHRSYFSTQSLFYVFNSCGYSVKEIKEVFESQFICIEAMPRSNIDESFLAHQDFIERLTHYIEEFSSNYRNKINTWQQTLEPIKHKRKRTVVWGAGSKGVTFLNTLQLQNQIDFVVDINPRKQNMYVAGTGQQIVPPEFLRDYKPDVIIGMNPIYIAEIKDIIKNIGIDTELISV